MTNWKNIHPEFTSELQEEWEGFGFIYDQVNTWIKDYGFSPTDADFAIYLGDNGCIIDELESGELERMRNEYNLEMERVVGVKKPSQERKIEEVIDPNDESWKAIKLDFTPKLVQEWQEASFSYKEIKDWIDIGIKTTEADLCSWLRNVKRVDLEWVLNHGDIKQLRDEYQKYLLLAQQIQID